MQDDLVCLPQKASAGMGNLGPVVLCTKVSAALNFMDVSNLRQSQVEVSQMKMLQMNSAVLVLWPPIFGSMLGAHVVGPCIFSWEYLYMAL